MSLNQEVSPVSTAVAAACSEQLLRIYDAVPAIDKPLVRSDSGRKSPRLVQRQQSRRSEILCAARRQIADGNEQVNVSQIADACGVAVQTIYNIAGDRNDILVAAIEEHYQVLFGIIAHSRNVALQESLIGSFWFVAQLNQDYVRNLSEMYFRQSSIAKVAIDTCLQRGFVRTFSAMAREYGVGVGAAERAAGRLHALMALSSREWLNGKVDLQELRGRLVDDFRIAVFGSLLPAGDRRPF